jgi:hypothetical protein
VTDHSWVVCTHAETEEGLPVATALTAYSRNRFILNLLPLLQQAPALRRVVTVFAAGHEGPVAATDLQGYNIPHLSSVFTLSLEALAEKAPQVSFIHNFPGNVKTTFFRDGESIVMAFLKAIGTLLGPLFYISNEECGERHVFLATSARFPAAAKSGDVASGVPLSDGIAVAKGTNGEVGSGVYSVDWKGESTGPKVEKLLAKLRREGAGEKVWADQEEQYKRIAGLYGSYMEHPYAPRDLQIVEDGLEKGLLKSESVRVVTL